MPTATPTRATIAGRIAAELEHRLDGLTPFEADASPAVVALAWRQLIDVARDAVRALDALEAAPPAVVAEAVATDRMDVLRDVLDDDDDDDADAPDDWTLSPAD
jgi:hypothetical protein